jgi:hypothetical protein
VKKSAGAGDKRGHQSGLDKVERSFARHGVQGNHERLFDPYDLRVHLEVAAQQRRIAGRNVKHSECGTASVPAARQPDQE